MVTPRFANQLIASPAPLGEVFGLIIWSDSENRWLAVFNLAPLACRGLSNSVSLLCFFVFAPVMTHVRFQWFYVASLSSSTHFVSYVI